MDLFLEALKWMLIVLAAGAPGPAAVTQGEPSPAGAPGQAKTEKKAFKAQAKQQKARRRKFFERAERPVIPYFNYYPEAQQRRL